MEAQIKSEASIFIRILFSAWSVLQHRKDLFIIQDTENYSSRAIKRHYDTDNEKQKQKRYEQYYKNNF